MKKIVILFLTAIFLFFIGIFIFSFFNSFQITGGVIINSYSYTKAVCNNSNYCEDYEIACKGNDLVSFTPTGAAIQFSNDWKDPRDKESIEKLC